MRIELDPQSTVPLYQQIRDRIVEGIARGTLVSGEALVSVRQLAVAFGINVATVGKGYELLRYEGLIRTNHKSGSVVARSPGGAEPSGAFMADWQRRLATLLAEGYAQGMPADGIRAAVETELTFFSSPTPSGSTVDAGEQEGSS